MSQIHIAIQKFDHTLQLVCGKFVFLKGPFLLLNRLAELIGQQPHRLLKQRESDLATARALFVQIAMNAQLHLQRIHMQKASTEGKRIDRSQNRLIVRKKHSVLANGIDNNPILIQFEQIIQRPSQQG